MMNFSYQYQDLDRFFGVIDFTHNMNDQLTTYNRIASAMKTNRWVLLCLFGILLVSVILRVHLLPIPLERDEGEYAYAGQLLLQGIPPYTMAYNMKMPGIYIIYALIIFLFGESPTAIHTGLLIVNLLTIISIFLFTRKLFNDIPALTAAAAFAVLSINPFVHGVFAHAEHFVILFIVSSLAILLYSVDAPSGKKIFVSGLIAGIAFLTKQHAASFIGLAISIMLLSGLFTEWKPTGKIFLQPLFFLMGVLSPLIFICIYFIGIGIWEKFIHWTFAYAREYVSMTDPLTGLLNLKHNTLLISNYSGALLILAGMGILLLFDPRMEKRKRAFLCLLIIFSFLSVTPGFYFREHYFIMLIPVVSLLVATSLQGIYKYLPITNRRIRILIPVLIFTLAVGSSLSQMHTYLFEMSPLSAARLTHGLNPLPESINIARYIRERSHPSEKIAVIGSEPQIYFYAQRKSVTGFIYMYPLMERQRFSLLMQQEMIREIESGKPQYLIFIHIPTSWLRRETSHDLILHWFFSYASRYYKQCALVEIIDPSTTRYYWDQGTLPSRPISPFWISIYKRIP